jgi:hypothetical protein
MEYWSKVLSHLGEHLSECQIVNFFEVSLPPGTMKLPAEPAVHLWDAGRIADAAVDLGMTNWISASTA